MDRYILMLVMIGSGLINSCGNRSNVLSDDLRNQCLNDLRELLAGQTGWIKVHVAEFLIWTGYPEGVRDAFLEESRKSGNIPRYRIGIWRVLAQASSSEGEQEEYICSIMAAFTDTAGDDRIHAAETLAKLGVSTLKDAEDITQMTLKEMRSPLGLYTKWSTAYTNPDSLSRVSDFFYKQIIARAEKQLDTDVVKLMAFVLGQINSLKNEQWQNLVRSVLQEPDHNPAKPNLLRAALVTAHEGADSNLLKKLRTDLFRISGDYGTEGKMQLLNVIALRGSREDFDALMEIYLKEKDVTQKTYDADVHAAAAYALLNLGRLSDQ